MAINAINTKVFPRTDFNEQIKKVGQILPSLGIMLDENQPHISGERFLQTKEKMVLLGNMNDKKAVIKISNWPGGKKEIEREKKIRDILEKVKFTTTRILFPKEYFYGEKNNFLIWVSEFIPQEKVFASYPLEEQFFLILKAFEDQEAFHATTFEQLKDLKNIFPIFYARDYFESLSSFLGSASELREKSISETLERALNQLKKEKNLIDTYCNYLTHTDFAPANFRLHSKKIYLIDLSSMQFGNKYEGWARFLNWSVVNDPEIEGLLLNYVRENRTKDELTVLNLMRIYKASFLIDFYIKTLSKTDGDLKKLNLERIGLWNEILKSLLASSPIPSELVYKYKNTRASLRSKEEIERQKEFNVI